MEAEIAANMDVLRSRTKNEVHVFRYKFAPGHHAVGFGEPSLVLKHFRGRE